MKRFLSRKALPVSVAEQREHRDGARRLHDRGQMCDISRTVCISGGE